MRTQYKAFSFGFLSPPHFPSPEDVLCHYTLIVALHLQYENAFKCAAIVPSKTLGGIFYVALLFMLTVNITF